MATFGFGGAARAADAKKVCMRADHPVADHSRAFAHADVAPITRAGRLLTVFWTIMSVLSLSAFTSVVSARLTVSQLAFTQITTLSQVAPQRLCVESSYPLAMRFVSDVYGLDGDLESAGVMLGSVQECAAAVLDGTVTAYITDQPLLTWLAYAYYDTGNLFVSPVLRSNPLSFAYPSGSAVRPRVDVAVMNLLTNSSWVAARDALDTAWFPQGLVTAPESSDGIDVPTFAAAAALVSAWLVISTVQYAQMAAEPIKLASAALRSGRLRDVTMHMVNAWAAGDDECRHAGDVVVPTAAGDDALLPQRVAPPAFSRAERAHSATAAAAALRAAAAAAAAAARAAEAFARDMNMEGHESKDVPMLQRRSAPAPADGGAVYKPPRASIARMDL
jgi:hypothetical protein